MDALDLISNIPAVLEFVIILAAAVAGFFALRKTVYRPIKKTFNKWNAGMDTLVGYDAVMDPGSGKELKPPTPPLAERVDNLETAMHRLIDLNESLLTISQRVLVLEEWQKVHAEWSEQWVKEIQDSNTTWQKEHETMHLLAHETAQQISKTTPDTL